MDQIETQWGQQSSSVKWIHFLTICCCKHQLQQAEPLVEKTLDHGQHDGKGLQCSRQTWHCQLKWHDCKSPDLGPSAIWTEPPGRSRISVGHNTVVSQLLQLVRWTVGRLSPPNSQLGEPTLGIQSGVAQAANRTWVKHVCALLGSYDSCIQKPLDVLALKRSWRVLPSGSTIVTLPNWSTRMSGPTGSAIV